MYKNLLCFLGSIMLVGLLFAQNDCLELLNKEIDMSNSKELMSDLELLDDCGLLPINFHNYSFANLFISDSLKNNGFSYKNLFDITTSGSYNSEIERCKGIRMSVANLSNWKEDKKQLMDCGWSYFEVLRMENYLHDFYGNPSEDSYIDISNKVEREDKKILDSIYFKITSFYKAENSARLFDADKYTLIYIKGFSKGDDLQKELKVLGTPGVLYKIYRDFNYYNIDLDDLRNMDNPELLSEAKDFSILSWLHPLIIEEFDKLESLNSILILDGQRMINKDLMVTDLNSFIEGIENY